jgi:ATP-dependent DNA helicase PIF1
MLSSEQHRVRDLIASGANVFLTGGGGVGKSFTIHDVVRVERARGRRVAVCASTGVAADHIGGVTLHSLLGQGLAADPLDELVRTACANRKLRSKWLQIDLLVVDEVSMLDPVFFEKTDHVVRALRNARDVPFGGVQVLLVGDFYQLPPVAPDRAPRTAGTGSPLCTPPPTFCFQTRSWLDVVHAVVELTYSFRQAGDHLFLELLNRARVGECTLDDIDTLAGRLNVDLSVTPRLRGIEPTRMHSRRTNVDLINESKLNELDASAPSASYTATMSYEVDRGDRANAAGRTDRDSVRDQKVKALQREVTKIQTYNNTPIKLELQLRVGAQVMLLWNLNTEQGLVNGSRGVVVGFVAAPAGAGVARDTVRPVVRFARTLAEVVIEPHTWEYKVEAAGVVSLTQMPLQLAWAITIHKAQGLSLDCVEMALDNSVFERGQAYVALSRATSLEGLRLTSFRPGVIVAHPLVKEFYRALAAAAVTAAATAPAPVHIPVPVPIM